MEHEEESKLLISFRKHKIELVLRNGTTVRHVKEQLIASLEQQQEQQQQQQQFSVSDMKLLFKGKMIGQNDDEEDIMEFVKSKSTGKKVQKQYRIMAMGRSPSEVQQMEDNFIEGIKNAPRIRDDLTEDGKKESERRKRLGRRMLHDAAHKTTRGATKKYGFGRIQVLSNLSEQQKARKILTELANDPGILACMAKHKWNVGSLSELYPDGRVGQSDVCVMGLNKNKGQEILLRIRTDDLRGFRKVLSIRKVLFHELAHNVHSEHDSDFFQLMRQIEKECHEMDWTHGSGLSLLESSATTVVEYTSGTHRLGGGGTSDWNAMTPRELAARAALERLTAEEEEIQNCCGCGINANKNLFLPKPDPTTDKSKELTDRMDTK